MHRREFLTTSSVSAFALAVKNVPNIFKDTSKMGIVVHSYSNRWRSKVVPKKYKGYSDALWLMEHCGEIGAGGVQINIGGWASDFAKEVRDKRESLGLYLEGSIRLPKNADELSKFEMDVINAKEAGANVLRTVCLNGRRYENFTTWTDFEKFKKQSVVSLQLVEPTIRKHKIKLAVENHKDWRATELVSLLRQVDSEWLGVTLDFGNSIALMEDPMDVVNTLAPYVMSTHVKDMAVKSYEDGFLLSGVPIGTGILDLPEIVKICKNYNPQVRFSLEMITRDPLKVPCLTDGYWPTFQGISGNELARSLRMVRDKEYKDDLPRISHLTDEVKLVVEENNVVNSLGYSRNKLSLI